MEPILRAIDRIENRLAEPLSLSEIARVAGFSTYHFCRYFRAMTGGSVMGYVRARRLSLAAVAVRDGRERLIDIAFDAGFESQEAFTRAFKRAFGTTPGALRRGRTDIDPFYLMPLLSENWLRAKQEAIPMNPKFVTLEERKISGLRQRVSRGVEASLPELWMTLNARMNEYEDAVEGAAYGLCIHGVEGGPGDFDYLAGVQVRGEKPEPDGMETVTLQARDYAVFTFSPETTELPDEFRRAYAYIFDTWLPSSGYRIARASDFEYYEKHRFDATTLSGEIDIYIPVEEKAA